MSVLPVTFSLAGESFTFSLSHKLTFSLASDNLLSHSHYLKTKSAFQKALNSAIFEYAQNLKDFFCSQFSVCLHSFGVASRDLHSSKFLQIILTTLFPYSPIQSTIHLNLLNYYSTICQGTQFLTALAFAPISALAITTIFLPVFHNLQVYIL